MNDTKESAHTSDVISGINIRSIVGKIYKIVQKSEVSNLSVLPSAVQTIPVRQSSGMKPFLVTRSETPTAMPVTDINSRKNGLQKSSSYLVNTSEGSDEHAGLAEKNTDPTSDVSISNTTTSPSTVEEMKSNFDVINVSETFGTTHSHNLQSISRRFYFSTVQYHTELSRSKNIFVKPEMTVSDPAFTKSSRYSTYEPVEIDTFKNISNHQDTKISLLHLDESSSKPAVYNSTNDNAKLDNVNDTFFRTTSSPMMEITSTEVEFDGNFNFRDDTKDANIDVDSIIELESTTEGSRLSANTTKEKEKDGVTNFPFGSIEFSLSTGSLSSVGDLSTNVPGETTSDVDKSLPFSNTTEMTKTQEVFHNINSTTSDQISTKYFDKESHRFVTGEITTATPVSLITEPDGFSNKSGTNTREDTTLVAGSSTSDFVEDTETDEISIGWYAFLCPLRGKLPLFLN